MTRLLKIETASQPKLTANTDKVNKAYEKALKFVHDDLKNIRERQAKAKENIQQYENELAVTGVDVAVVKDDKKRSKLLARREELQRLIKEEELYLNLDIQSYKNRIIEEQNLDELRYKAGREYRTTNLEVKAYREAVEKEAKRSIELATAMVEQDNEYLKLLAQHQGLTGKQYTRWEQER